MGNKAKDNLIHTTATKFNIILLSLVVILENFIVLIPNYNISELELIDRGYYY
jgi:hypothetical protein